MKSKINRDLNLFWSNLTFIGGDLSRGHIMNELSMNTPYNRLNIPADIDERLYC